MIIHFVALCATGFSTDANANGALGLEYSSYLRLPAGYDMCALPCHLDADGSSVLDTIALAAIFVRRRRGMFNDDGHGVSNIKSLDADLCVMPNICRLRSWSIDLIDGCNQICNKPTESECVITTDHTQTALIRNGCANDTDGSSYPLNMLNSSYAYGQGRNRSVYNAFTPVFNSTTTKNHDENSAFITADKKTVSENEREGPGSYNCSDHQKCNANTPRNNGQNKGEQLGFHRLYTHYADGTAPTFDDEDLGSQLVRNVPSCSPSIINAALIRSTTSMSEGCIDTDNWISSFDIRLVKSDSPIFSEHLIAREVLVDHQLKAEFILKWTGLTGIPDIPNPKFPLASATGAVTKLTSGVLPIAFYRKWCKTTSLDFTASDFAPFFDNKTFPTEWTSTNSEFFQNLAAKRVQQNDNFELACDWLDGTEAAQKFGQQEINKNHFVADIANQEKRKFVVAPPYKNRILNPFDGSTRPFNICNLTCAKETTGNCKRNITNTIICSEAPCAPATTDCRIQPQKSIIDILTEADNKNCSWFRDNYCYEMHFTTDRDKFDMTEKSLFDFYGPATHCCGCTISSDLHKKPQTADLYQAANGVNFKTDNTLFPFKSYLRTVDRASPFTFTGGSPNFSDESLIGWCVNSTCYKGYGTTHFDIDKDLHTTGQRFQLSDVDSGNNTWIIRSTENVIRYIEANIRLGPGLWPCTDFTAAPPLPDHDLHPANDHGFLFLNNKDTIGFYDNQWTHHDPPQYDEVRDAFGNIDPARAQQWSAWYDQAYESHQPQYMYTDGNSPNTWPNANAFTTPLFKGNSQSDTLVTKGIDDTAIFHYNFANRGDLFFLPDDICYPTEWHTSPSIAENLPLNTIAQLNHTILPATSAIPFTFDKNGEPHNIDITRITHAVYTTPEWNRYTNSIADGLNVFERSKNHFFNISGAGILTRKARVIQQNTTIHLNAVLANTPLLNALNLNIRKSCDNVSCSDFAHADDDSWWEEETSCIYALKSNLSLPECLAFDTEHLHSCVRTNETWAACTDEDPLLNEFAVSKSFDRYVIKNNTWKPGCTVELRSTPVFTIGDIKYLDCFYDKNEAESVYSPSLKLNHSCTFIQIKCEGEPPITLSHDATESILTKGSLSLEIYPYSTMKSRTGVYGCKGTLKSKKPALQRSNNDVETSDFQKIESDCLRQHYYNNASVCEAESIILYINNVLVCPDLPEYPTAVSVGSSFTSLVFEDQTFLTIANANCEYVHPLTNVFLVKQLKWNTHSLVALTLKNNLVVVVGFNNESPLQISIPNSLTINSVAITEKGHVAAAHKNGFTIWFLENNVYTELDQYTQYVTGSSQLEYDYTRLNERKGAFARTTPEALKITKQFEAHDVVAIPFNPKHGILDNSLIKPKGNVRDSVGPAQFKENVPAFLGPKNCIAGICSSTPYTITPSDDQPREQYGQYGDDLDELVRLDEISFKHVQNWDAACDTNDCASFVISVGSSLVLVHLAVGPNIICQSKKSEWLKEQKRRKDNGNYCHPTIPNCCDLENTPIQTGTFTPGVLKWGEGNCMHYGGFWCDVLLYPAITMNDENISCGSANTDSLTDSNWKNNYNGDNPYPSDFVCNSDTYFRDYAIDASTGHWGLPPTLRWHTCIDPESCSGVPFKTVILHSPREIRTMCSASCGCATNSYASEIFPGREQPSCTASATALLRVLDTNQATDTLPSSPTLAAANSNVAFGSTIINLAENYPFFGDEIGQYWKGLYKTNRFEIFNSTENFSNDSITWVSPTFANTPNHFKDQPQCRPAATIMLNNGYSDDLITRPDLRNHKIVGLKCKDPPIRCTTQRNGFEMTPGQYSCTDDKTTMLPADPFGVREGAGQALEPITVANCEGAPCDDGNDNTLNDKCYATTQKPVKIATLLDIGFVPQSTDNNVIGMIYHNFETRFLNTYYSKVDPNSCTFAFINVEVTAAVCQTIAPPEDRIFIYGNDLTVVYNESIGFSPLELEYNHELLYFENGDTKLCIDFATLAKTTGCKKPDHNFLSPMIAFNSNPYPNNQVLEFSIISNIKNMYKRKVESIEKSLLSLVTPALGWVRKKTVLNKSLFPIGSAAKFISTPSAIASVMILAPHPVLDSITNTTFLNLFLFNINRAYNRFDEDAKTGIANPIIHSPQTISASNTKGSFLNNYSEYDESRPCPQFRHGPTEIAVLCHSYAKPTLRPVRIEITSQPLATTRNTTLTTNTFACAPRIANYGTLPVTTNDKFSLQTYVDDYTPPWSRARSHPPSFLPACNTTSSSQWSGFEPSCTNTNSICRPIITNTEYAYKIGLHHQTHLTNIAGIHSGSTNLSDTCEFACPKHFSHESLNNSFCKCTKQLNPLFATVIHSQNTTQTLKLAAISSASPASLNGLITLTFSTIPFPVSLWLTDETYHIQAFGIDIITVTNSTIVITANDLQTTVFNASYIENVKILSGPDATPVFLTNELAVEVEIASSPSTSLSALANIPNPKNPNFPKNIKTDQLTILTPHTITAISASNNVTVVATVEIDDQTQTLNCKKITCPDEFILCPPLIIRFPPPCKATVYNTATLIDHAHVTPRAQYTLNNSRHTYAADLNDCIKQASDANYANYNAHAHKTCSFSNTSHPVITPHTPLYALSYAIKLSDHKTTLAVIAGNHLQNIATFDHIVIAAAISASSILVATPKFNFYAIGQNTTHINQSSTDMSITHGQNPSIGTVTITGTQLPHYETVHAHYSEGCNQQCYASTPFVLANYTQLDQFSSCHNNHILIKHRDDSVALLDCSTNTDRRTQSECIQTPTAYVKLSNSPCQTTRTKRTPVIYQSPYFANIAIDNITLSTPINNWQNAMFCVVLDSLAVGLKITNIDAPRTSLAYGVSYCNISECCDNYITFTAGPDTAVNLTDTAIYQTIINAPTQLQNGALVSLTYDSKTECDDATQLVTSNRPPVYTKDCTIAQSIPSTDYTTFVDYTNVIHTDAPFPFPTASWPTTPTFSSNTCDVFPHSLQIMTANTYEKSDVCGCIPCICTIKKTPTKHAYADALVTIAVLALVIAKR
jgi:hypothetical protein